MHLGLATMKKQIFITTIVPVVFFAIVCVPQNIFAQETEGPAITEEPTQSSATEEAEIEEALTSETEEEPDVSAETEVPQPELAPEEALPLDSASEAEEEGSGATAEATGVTSEGELTYPPEVEVEKSVYYNKLQTKDCDCKYTYLMPYRERRSTLGTTVGIGYSTFSPDNYKPDFVVNETLESYYGYAESSLIDLTIGIKWNMFLGALSFDFGAGYYMNEGKDDSTLTLIPARAGITLSMDTIFSEPYVVPYATVGAYSVFFNEKLAAQKKEGNTPIGLYWAAGVQFQLNWLDENTAIVSYDETGLENTYVFAEARSFLESNELDDFSTDPQVGAGLRVEY